jgi:hypothetical protein
VKQLIKDILEDVAKGQPNLESEAAREMISNLIMAGIKSNKGWFLDLGTVKCQHGNLPVDGCDECTVKEQGEA